MVVAGHVVCFPTESSYGLAVDPRNDSALARLVALKGRAEHAPFALVAATMAQAQACTTNWPSQAEELAQIHWPGPLTMILPAALEVGRDCKGAQGGAGVRISSSAIARSLAKAVGYAITATSANPAGERPASTVLQARAYFGEAVSLYLDGGICDGPASTVLSFGEGGSLDIVRAGAIVLRKPSRP